MQKRSVIEISTTTLIGIAIAIPVFLFVILPIMQKVLGFLIPRPDIITLQNYERLVNEIKELKEGETTYVPFHISGDYKVVSYSHDNDCFPESCLCLCNIGDCKTRVFEKECFRGYSLNLNAYSKGTRGEIHPKGLVEETTLLMVEKRSNSITLNDPLSAEDKVCCKITKDDETVEYSFTKPEECFAPNRHSVSLTTCEFLEKQKKAEK